METAPVVVSSGMQDRIDTLDMETAAIAPLGSERVGRTRLLRHRRRTRGGATRQDHVTVMKKLQFASASSLIGTFIVFAIQVECNFQKKINFLPDWPAAPWWLSLLFISMYAVPLVALAFFVHGALSGSYKRRMWRHILMLGLWKLPVLIVGAFTFAWASLPAIYDSPNFFGDLNTSMNELMYFTCACWALLCFVSPLVLIVFTCRNFRHFRRAPGGFSARWHFQWRRRREWLPYILEANIKWVRASTFRRWHENGQRLSRSQELQREDFVVGGKGLGRIIVSHAWLSPNHPDPDGHQLRNLVEEFDRLEIKDDELVFYDFCSLPQRDRTADEDVHFGRALAMMHFLYTLGFAKVLVLPWIPDGAYNARPYKDRGWCFFELSVSADYGRIMNSESPQVAELLENMEMPLKADKFCQELTKKTFTGRADELVVERLYKQVSRRKMCEGLVGLSVFFVVAFAHVGFLLMSKDRGSASDAVNQILTAFLWISGICLPHFTFHPFVLPPSVGPT